MGTQGEIYVVLGLKIPVERVGDSHLYSANGKKIFVGWSKEKVEFDFDNGFTSVDPIKLDKPKLGVKILGLDLEYGDMIENGEALFGYAIANESYTTNAKVIPKNEVIEGLKPKLVADFRERLGIEAKPGDLELFLLYEFSQ